MKQARISFEDTENLLNNIAKQRRIKTWNETTLKWVKYLGYASIGWVAAYLSYSIGLLDLIKPCISTKLELFYVKNKVETPTHIVTNNAGVQPLLQETTPVENKRIKI